MSTKLGTIGSNSLAKKKKPSSSTKSASSTSSSGNQTAREVKDDRITKLRPATVDLSQCHNESLDLVRLILSLHPTHLTEARHRLNHFAMQSGADGDGYFDRLASLLWTGRAAAKNLENFHRMNMRLGGVTTNHFPAMDDMCNKNYLAKKLKFFGRVFPNHYDFVPKTWILPQEWETLKADVTAAANAATNGNNQTYIFKPSAGSQGSGIMLAQKLTDIEKIYRQGLEDGISFTVQEYLSKPLLLGGLKFDFRIYVVLESLEPLRFHLYQDGLARFCTENYVEPNAKNLKQAFMHLTNSSLNKNNEEKFKIHSTADLSEEEKRNLNQSLLNTMVECKENMQPPTASPTSATSNASASPSASPLPPMYFPSEFSFPHGAGGSPTSTNGTFGFDLNQEDSSKRTIRTVLQQLNNERKNSGQPIEEKSFWNSIRDIVAKTIIALWAPAMANYKVAFPTHKPSKDFPSACFHILGFDIILDDQCKPWLLELNCSPSLNIESTLDLILKKSMLEKALGLLGFLGEQRKRRRNNPRQSPPPQEKEMERDALASSVSSSSVSSSASSSASSSNASTPQQTPHTRFPPIPNASANPNGNPSNLVTPLTLDAPAASTNHRFTSASTSTTPRGTRLRPSPPSAPEATAAVTNTTPTLPNAFASTSSSSSTNQVLPPHPPIVAPPIIPMFTTHRRSASLTSGISPIALAKRFVVLPGGNIQAIDSSREEKSSIPKAAPPAVAVSSPVESSLVTDAAKQLLNQARPNVSVDQENVEYMEICPAEEIEIESKQFEACYTRSEHDSNCPPHPLLFFQHPKLQLIFDRYSTGTVKKLSSNKFMQACVACKVTGASPSFTHKGVAMKAISNWPTRPDIDLLFMQHTKLDSGAASITNGAASSSSGAGAGKMMDYATFCDVLFHIAETKYRHLINLSQLTPAAQINVTNAAEKNAPASLAAGAGSLSLLDAFLYFMDSLALPEEKAVPSISGASAAREASLKATHQQLSLTMNPATLAAYSLTSPTNYSVLPPAHQPKKPITISVRAANHTNAAAASSNDDSPAPATGNTVPAISPNAASVNLAATLSSIFAPKDPSSSVFNRLTGVAPAPVSSASSSLKKKRREKEKLAGSYEAFMQAYKTKEKASKSTKSKK